MRLLSSVNFFTCPVFAKDASRKLEHRSRSSSSHDNSGDRGPSDEEEFTSPVSVLATGSVEVNDIAEIRVSCEPFDDMVRSELDASSFEVNDIFVLKVG